MTEQEIAQMKYALSRHIPFSWGDWHTEGYILYRKARAVAFWDEGENGVVAADVEYLRPEIQKVVPQIADERADKYAFDDMIREAWEQQAGHHLVVGSSEAAALAHEVRTLGTGVPKIG